MERPVNGLPDDPADDASGRLENHLRSSARASEIVGREVGPEAVIPIVEERAWIEKHAVETGRVRVGTRTETTEQVLRESLRGNAVGVTRVPINRTLAEGESVPVTREEDGVTIIPVLEEILVVEKRLVLKEEVHIRQTTTGEDVEVPVTLRRQHAVVERVSADGQVIQAIPSALDQEETA